jgi:hypothetical protein
MVVGWEFDGTRVSVLATVTPCISQLRTFVSEAHLLIKYYCTLVKTKSRPARFQYSLLMAVGIQALGSEGV